MLSVNFEFLRPSWGELASLGGFAERYAHPDPCSAAVKLRAFAEQFTHTVYQRHGLPRPHQPTFNDLLNSASFVSAVPRVVCSKLHSLRVHGNKAAHGEAVSGPTVVWLLQEAFDLGRWLHATSSPAEPAEYPKFIAPAKSDGDGDKVQERERAALARRFAAQEAEMQRLLADMEAARSDARAAQSTAAQLQAALGEGQRAAAALAFDEQATRRRLIDSLLAAAGWGVGAAGASTESVGQEVEVLHQPTAGGSGRADYVPWGDDGKPLAVVEAKRTADAEAGRTQAKLYADGLEQAHGRRPAIFYTNGHDVWLWHDALGEPPRRLFGFYSKDSLEYLHFQRLHRGRPADTPPAPDIAGRMYQIEAIRRVVERFSNRHRKALVVQATGTGKTRVAVSLCDVLLRAKWARRVLFLCDRRELRKQAHNAFKAHLPGEPRVFVTAATAQDRDKRVYLATYPAMMECYESFDVGFFDLIIADESHRSIYNRYRDLFAHFDALQVGLTATPVEFIARNTYKIFGCEDRDPTSYFSLEDAVNHNPPYLTPFEVVTHTTPFLRRGIRWADLSDDQKRQAEEDADPDALDYDAREIDQAVFNKDTNRHVLRNLMENGIRDASGTRVGKSIIFARNHNHAMLLQTLFDEMYPQYGGNFCRVIDSHDTRAESLIDDFKGEGGNLDLTVAVSVDMLDTGVDVPEVVNLVFAKPVKSYVKFWQMIGRGTRLCPNLFGPGRHKSRFLIFDHWGNFEYFDLRYKAAEPKAAKSLPQRVFEARIALADAALAAQNLPAFESAVALIAADIADLPRDTVAVREKWREVAAVSDPDVLGRYAAATRDVLVREVAPLMQWRNLAGAEPAHQFDLLVCRAQTAAVQGAAGLADRRAELQNEVGELRVNLSQVRAVADTLAEVRSEAFWADTSVEGLERVRQRLRGVMQYRLRAGGPALPPRVLDITEDASLIERRPHAVKLEGLQLAAYRNRVESVLRDLFDRNPTLQRIGRGEPVGPDDLAALVSLVLTQDPLLNLNDLLGYYPDCAGHLDLAIRAVIGLDAAAVSDRFTRFVREHPTLNSTQIRFLDMLQNHIAKYGSIELGRLYEAPFTGLHANSIDGLFTDEAEIDSLLGIIESFQPPNQGGRGQ